MYINPTTLLALLATPLLTLAQNANPFSIPSAGLSFTGGEASQLNWNPTTSGTISLILRSGSANNLNEGTIIACTSSRFPLSTPKRKSLIQIPASIPNSGSYTWTPSNSLTSGTDYTIEIVSDSNPAQTNYTPYFTLTTTTTSSQQTSEITLGAPLSTPVLSSASPTGQEAGTMTVHATTTMATTDNSVGVQTVTPGTSYNLPIHNTFTSLGGSGNAGLTTLKPTVTGMTVVAGSTITGSSVASRSASSSGAASVPSQGAAATGMRAGAAGGILGAVVAGALAL